MKIEFFNYLFLALIGLISISVIKRDVKKKKIRNADIIKGFAMGTILYLIAAIIGSVELSYVQNVFLNTISAALVVYIFWLLNFWPAGDAKFFILLSFLLPMTYYSNSYFPVFPSFVLLVNIFCVSFLFLILNSFYYLFYNVLKRKFIKIYLSRILKIKKNSKLIDGLRLFARKIFINMLIIFLFSISALSSGRIFNGNAYDFLLNYSFGFLVSMVVVYILNIYLEDTQDYEIPREGLKEGMTLSLKTLNGGYLEKEFLAKIGVLRADGLNAYQVGEVCNIFRTKRIDKIWVQKHIPFSPWILLGVFITILLKGSLLEIIFNLF